MFPRQLYYVAQTMLNQWKTPEEIKKLQEKRIKKLLHYAYEKTPLFHEKCRELNITPSDFHKLEDIKKFPCTSKADMRENFPEGVVSPDYDIARCYRAATSGSTGQNLYIVYSPEAYEYYMAVSFRNFAALGYKPWQKFAYMRYEPIKIKTQFYEKLGITRRLYVSVYSEPEEQLNIVREFNPHAVTGYPSMLIEWAKILKEQGNTIHPHFIRCEAEILTKEAKEFMEDVFSCSIYEEYGSAEFVLHMSECLHGGFHISSDSILMEFLVDGEEAAPGEEGDIHITSLVSYAMPFIRYKIDDRGVPLDEKCTCGRGLPLMKLVVGRDDDFLVLPSGKRVNPRIIIPYFELAPGVKEFRIIQKKKDFIVIDLIKGPLFTEEVHQTLKKSLLDTLREPVEIVFNFCDEIPRGRHNRPRPIQSLVDR